MFSGRSTFIYLVVVLGLVCYLTFIDKRIPSTSDAAKAELHLFTFDQSLVTGLEITNVHGSFTFENKNDHWEITSPVKTLADASTMSEIIGAIDDAQPQRTIPMEGTRQDNENNLREWGLAPPAEKAVIHFKDKSIELLIGRKVAINASVYARTSEHNDASVSVVPVTIKEALEKTLSDFRSRSVFDFESDKVTRVASSVANTPTTPAQEAEVIYKGGRWTLQKPLVARAATPEVQALLEKLLGLRVTDFITDDPGNTAQYGLTTPSTTLSVSVGPDDEGVLQVGSPVPGHPEQVYAQRLKSNAIFTLEQGGIADVVKTLPNVRDRHVLPFDPGTATGVTIDLSGVKTLKATLSRDKAGIWQVVGASAGQADVGKISELLTRLSALETTPVIKDSAPDLKPFGLDQPTGKIEVAFPSEKALTLQLGKTENNLIYVRNSIEPFIYTVPATTFDFLGDNLSYREKRVVRLTAAKVKSLTVMAQGRPPLILDRSPGGTWTPESVKDRQIDATKTDSQVSILCDLQAEKWLGAPKPEYGLDQPVLTFSLLAEMPTATIVKIGAPLPDGTHAAQIQGQPDVFAMSEGDFGLLNASSLQLIPGEVPATNAPSLAPALTNAPSLTPAQAAASGTVPPKSALPTKKKKKISGG